MTRIAKTLKVNKRIAMSFIGRTFARLRHLQKVSKLSLKAVELVVKETFVAIYLDGIEVLKATRDSMVEWNIDVTERLHNLLQSQEQAA